MMNLFPFDRVFQPKSGSWGRQIPPSTCCRNSL